MKPDLLILHGALGCKEQFTTWAEALSEQFQCHLLDFSGHGSRSGENVEFSIELFSENLKKYIQDHNLERPNVLGYSMGGYVALYLALKQESALGSIMTLATKFDWNRESAKKEAGYLKPDLMLQKVPQLAWQLKDRHGANWQRVVERTATMMLKLGEAPILTPLTIGGVNNRVKFCVGDKDKMVSIQETEAIYRGAANAGLSILRDMGHLPETMDLKLIAREAQDLLIAPADQ